MKISCLNPIAAVGMQLFTDAYEKVDDFATSDAALVRSASVHELELPDQLLAIARAGAGVNNIPLDKCAEKGIVVFNTPGANANGVKEAVLAGLFLGARDIVGGVNWVQTVKEDSNVAKLVEKGKKQFAGTEIMGKKIGVIGLGAIGVLVANACVALGMEVYGYDPFISVDAAWRGVSPDGSGQRCPGQYHPSGQCHRPDSQTSGCDGGTSCDGTTADRGCESRSQQTLPAGNRAQNKKRAPG